MTWENIREPRHIKVVFAVYYFVAAILGAITVIFPPDIVERVYGVVPWGWIVVLAFSVFLLLGGIASLMSVFPGWWWLERLGNISCLLSVFLFVLVVLYDTFALGSSTGPIQVGVGLLASGIFAIRMLMIRGFSFEPREVVGA